MKPAYDPHQEYTRRLAARRASVARHARVYDRLALSRLATALLVAVLLWLVFWRGALSPAWLLPPLAAFLGLVVASWIVDTARQRARKAVRFYEDGLARIEDRWMGRGERGEAFQDEKHLYAADLDIFGPGSLFELLSTARTAAGETVLARWLTAPAAADEIRARQEAVAELRFRLDLREDLATLGAAARSSLHPAEMTRWGEAPPSLAARWPRTAAPVLAVFAFAATAAVLISGSDRAWLFFYAALAGVAGFALWFRARVQAVVTAAGNHRRELEILTEVLLRLEREEFASARLSALRRALETDRQAPSRQLHRFARLADMCEWKRAELVLALVLLVIVQGAVLILPFNYALWLTQLAFALEAWRGRVGPRLGAWMEIVGEFEALCALAGYAYEHPDDPFPEIVDDGPEFDGEAIRHPLRPAADFVPNSVRLDRRRQLIVVSGSNMSGKSTLLRTVGVNTVLALAGAPVRARRLRVAPMRMGATLRVQDSLQAGTSRFYAEILRIREIMQAAAGAPPVLFLLDEVLHGTNSHDRAIGAEGIVRGLLQRGAVGLATTHDLALARVADALGERAINVHFEDRMENGRMAFDYTMKPGVVEKSNALELMRAVGLEV